MDNDPGASGRRRRQWLPFQRRTYLTDKSFVVNGRVALADIDLQSKAKLQLSLWSRNLFNEQHVFYRAGFAYGSTGPTGIYNEPRTYGIDAPVKF